MNDPVTVNAPRAPGLEGRLEAFEAALAAGGSVDLFRFLPPAGDPEYLPTLCELVRTDLEARWALGRPKGLAEYQQQYPELFADPELAAAVAFEDRRQRELHQTGVVPVNPVGGSTRAVPRSEFERYAAASSGAGNGAAGLDRTRLPDVGTEFLGFRLTEELGTGGFGRVYLAQQLALSDRPVALKVTVRPNREAQHLARLQHTNIVPVLSVHEADGLQALCMPYFGRSTLRQVINSIRLQPSLPASGAGLISTLRLSAHQTVREDGGPAPAAGTPAPAADSTAAPTRDRLAHLGYVDAVVWLVARIADGLAHAHERGILHRDLKPANVLLADDGQPMLLDFNLAHHSPGAAGASGGTLLYMSPEHLAAFAGDRTRTVDARSDLYSLGLVMYELLTARHPSLPERAEGGPTTSVAALLEARSRRPNPARLLNPSVAPAVDAVVARLLEPDPDRRYQNARQLQEDLDRHLADLPLRHARNPSLGELGRKWLRRNPRAVPYAGLAAAAALTACLGALAVDRGRAQARAEAVARASARAEADALAAAEARTRCAEFRGDLQAARVLLTACAGDPTTHAAGVARARAALARYGGEAEWDAHPAIDRLPEGDRAVVRGDIGEALFLLARAAARPGGTAEALALTRRAERCFPAGDAPAAVTRQRAELAGRLGLTTEAAEAARPDRARAEGARDAYLDGAGKAVAGQWADAVPPLERAWRLDPRHLAATFALGYCYDALGRDAEALECYRACTALHPEFPWAHLNRGVVYMRRGDSARAQTEFDEAVRLAPGWSDAYFTRGTLHQRAGRFKEALADYDRAEQLNSPRARLYLLRAQVKVKLNDQAGADRDRAHALAAPAADENDHLACGVAHLPAQPEKALAEFDRALALNPQSMPAMQNRAHVLAEYLNRGPDAVAALDRLLEQYPTSARAWGGRAVLRARLGDRAAAHRDATECLRRDTGPGTLYQLAGVYALTSKAEPEDRREALRLLAAAFTAGFRDFATLERDHDLDPIRQIPEFLALIKEFRPDPVEMKKK